MTIFLLLRPVLSTAIELLATQRHVGILKPGYKDGPDSYIRKTQTPPI